MSYTIESGIPCPNSASLGVMRQTLRSMGPGQSFVVKTAAERQNAIGSAKKEKMKIATRAQPDGSFRIWRIE